MLQFLGGLIFFLGGLEAVKINLEKISAGRIEALLAFLNKNIFLSLFCGIIITALLQSSSAVSIILIGFLQAGFIELKQAVYIMLGANIGTTVTVHIISFPVKILLPYLMFIGLCLFCYGLIKKNNLKYQGLVLISFAFVFQGLYMMTLYFKKTTIKIIIVRFMQNYGKNTFYALFIGFLVTAVIQSSSAATGITITLAYNDLISLRTAVLIALGSNMGTCITGFLASINYNRQARLLALIHFLINLLGVMFILPFIDQFIYFVTLTAHTLPRQIANAHSMFNIINTILIFPFIQLITAKIENIYPPFEQDN